VYLPSGHILPAAVNQTDPHFGINIVNLCRSMSFSFPLLFFHLTSRPRLVRLVFLCSILPSTGPRPLHSLPPCVHSILVRFPSHTTAMAPFILLCPASPHCNKNRTSIGGPLAERALNARFWALEYVEETAARGETSRRRLNCGGDGEKPGK
jgi:hypothetical protein